MRLCCWKWALPIILEPVWRFLSLGSALADPRARVQQLDPLGERGVMRYYDLIGSNDAAQEVEWANGLVAGVMKAVLDTPPVEVGMSGPGDPQLAATHSLTHRSVPEVQRCWSLPDRPNPTLHSAGQSSRTRGNYRTRTAQLGAFPLAP